ncbi:MAG: 4'-phosphopantetheinyl transferase superfamily protein [Lentimicrobium sp.]|uniref:4'-phosphopantetheinyl transferase family protein n=3 Tax=Lentimicrobium sp. TaxID=2034841 RepID=UPI0025FC8C49|nr:4'-phosphopantetheinyl transferase superfamily protein [Lentimicrobium sp.]MCO5258071.1 4'-phosphopantetheinyl transferase superfamily protein [Lentimicrobium sp.]
MITLTHTEVYGIELLPDEQFGELQQQLLAKVPASSRPKFGRYAQVRDVQRSLLGEVLTRHLLRRVCGKLPEDMVFTTGEKGKPEPAGFRGIHFNISHSGDWVVAALSSSAVGVDVERMRKAPEGVANRFFSEKEKAWLAAAGDEKEKAEIFFTLWTLKESFLKAIGTGLTRSLSTFTIVNDARGLFSLEDDSGSGRYYLKNWPFREGYKLSACAGSPDFAGEPVIININELI